MGNYVYYKRLQKYKLFWITVKFRVDCCCYNAYCSEYAIMTRAQHIKTKNGGHIAAAAILITYYANGACPIVYFTTLPVMSYFTPSTSIINEPFSTYFFTFWLLAFCAS